jgi:hypothetical protein
MHAAISCSGRRVNLPSAAAAQLQAHSALSMTCHLPLRAVSQGALPKLISARCSTLIRRSAARTVVWGQTAFSHRSSGSSCSTWCVLLGSLCGFRNQTAVHFVDKRLCLSLVALCPGHDGL